jgi:hypothetical protein
MPALLLKDTVMIIWDDREPYGPRRGDTCMFCYGPLRPPLVMWHASDYRDIEEPRYERFICNECCVDMCHGLSADLRRMKTAKAIERMGFGHAAQRAVTSGGLLYATGTDNKQ